MKGKPGILSVVVPGCALGLLLFLKAENQTPQIPQTPVKIIAVSESTGLPEYQQAVAGFNEILKKENLSIDLKMYAYDPENEINVEEIKTQKPALVLTLGSNATHFISEKITDIPIVFAMVMDPRGSGITSKNIVGASLDIPVTLQLEHLKAVVPRVKRVGVVYSPAENESIIREARQAAGNLGLVLKAYPVKSHSEIPRIKDLAIDVLWIIPDTILLHPAILKRILLSSIRKRLPVMGCSRSFARGGALLAISCDYEDIGKQAGEMAARILKGETYSQSKTSKPRKIKLYINQMVADRIGITIPGKILREADEVFGKK